MDAGKVDKGVIKEQNENPMGFLSNNNDFGEAGTFIKMLIMSSP